MRVLIFTHNAQEALDLPFPARKILPDMSQQERIEMLQAFVEDPNGVLALSIRHCTGFRVPKGTLVLVPPDTPEAERLQASWRAGL